jgi:transposase
MEGSGMAKSSVAVLGIDLGKNSCSLVGFNPAGTVVLRRRARRETIIGLTAKLPACVVAMEAWLAAPITLGGCWPRRDIPSD